MDSLIKLNGVFSSEEGSSKMDSGPVETESWEGLYSIRRLVVSKYLILANVL